MLAILIGNAFKALEWEALLLRAVFDLNNASALLGSIGCQSFAQLSRQEAVINAEPWESIEVRNVDSLKVVGQAGGKETGARRKADRSTEERKDEGKQAAGKRSLEEERKERESKWKESWERRLQKEEELEDATCCLGEGLCLKPRTQSNIWINVFQDRMIQEVQMTFK